MRRSWRRFAGAALLGSLPLTAGLGMTLFLERPARAAADVQINIDNADPVTEGGDMIFPVNTFDDGDLTQCPPNNGEILVDFFTQAGSADTADFTAVTGTVALGRNNGSSVICCEEIVVPTIDDNRPEDDQFLTVRLTNLRTRGGSCTGAFFDASASGVIRDDGDALPTLRVNDDPSPEGLSNTFVITKSGATEQTVSVRFVTSSGSAISGTDFNAVSSTVVFSPSQVSRVVNVGTIEDAIDEPDETFNVRLFSPSNSTIADANGVGTITDDDQPPTLSITDVSVNEGNVGTKAALFNVSMTGATAFEPTVSFVAAAGTAASGSDFQPRQGTLTFSSTNTSIAVTVQVIGDAIGELNETFRVTLSTPTNATIADGEGIGTIIDDDPFPSFSIDDVSVNEGNAGTVAATFTVTRTGATSFSTGVSFQTASGSATSGSDFQATSGFLAFTTTQASRTITVDVLGDELDEQSETFTVNLSSPSNATIADGQGVGTIVDDDGAGSSLVISDVTLTEGNGGDTSASFGVSRVGATTQTTTVDFATAAGTATSGVDFQPAAGTLTFGPGDTAKVVQVTVIGDELDESDESFFVNLSNATNATVADGQGLGTIIDDDDPPPTVPAFSIDDVTVIEGDGDQSIATFTVTKSGTTSQATTVQFATAPDSATTDVDYVSKVGLLSVAANETTKTITVGVIGDTTDEPDETFFVNLTDASNATIADGQGVGTITDDDDPNTMQVGDAAVVEGDDGTTDAVFTITKTGSSGIVTVDVGTADETAVAPGDYAPTAATLSFEANELTKTVVVPVVGDESDEPDETFVLHLFAATNAAVIGGPGVGTISDDDDPAAIVPAVSIDDASVKEGKKKTTTALAFTLRLSAPVASPVTVYFATSDDTAISPKDYARAEGIVEFAPGDTEKAVNVVVRGDRKKEKAENFLVALWNATGAVISDGDAIGTIINDDRRRRR